MRKSDHTLSPFLLAGVLLLSAGLCDAAKACPVCDTSTGQQVREGIFGEDFGPTLFKVLLPFPVVALLLAGLRKIFPAWLHEGGARGAQGSARASLSSPVKQTTP